MGPVGGRGRGPPACLKHRTPETGVGPLGDRGHPRTPDAQRGRPQRRPARSQPGSGPPAVPGPPPPRGGALPGARPACSRTLQTASPLPLRLVAFRGDGSSPCGCVWGPELPWAVPEAGLGAPEIAWSVGPVVPPRGGGGGSLAARRTGTPQAVAEAQGRVRYLGPAEAAFSRTPSPACFPAGAVPRGLRHTVRKAASTAAGILQVAGPPAEQHLPPLLLVPKPWAPGLAPAGGAPAPPAGHTAAELEA